MMNNWFNEKSKVILLSAMAITLFLALPRMVIILYVKSNAILFSDSANASWKDFILRGAYSFMIATLFLAINTSRRKMINSLGTINMNKFYQRFALTLIGFLIIRYLSIRFDLHVPGMAVSERFYRFMFNITLVLEVLLCVLIAEIYMLVVSNQKVRIANEALQKVNAKATYEVLKNQVNPHFLFNSFNTAHAMIDVDKEGAKAFLENMSRTYRYVLQSSETALVSLRKELEFTKAYLDVLKQRHFHKLNLEVDIDKASLKKMLPPMSLQILIENAIKHNVISEKYPLSIQIKSHGNYINVVNSIMEKKMKQPSAGTGLYILSQRYAYLGQKEIEIKRSATHFDVTLPLLNGEADHVYHISER